MELGKGINQQSEAASNHILHRWVPVNPAKPYQPPRTTQSDWVQSAPGGIIYNSGARYAFDATGSNVGLMSFSNQMQNDMAGMGRGMPYLQLLQLTSAQAGSNLMPSYIPVLCPQIDGFNQLMYMDNPSSVNTAMTGTNPPYNHTLHLSALVPTGSQNSCANSTAEVPTNSNNNNAVSLLAPATPDQRAKHTRGRHPPEPINPHIDAQWHPTEKDKDGQSRYSFEAQVANYQDQCNPHTQENEPTSCIRQENGSISLSSEQGSTQLANKSGILAQPLMNASLTSSEPVTPLKESHNHVRKEDCQGIDLNKTPQQKQKRKKHRPKVVREAKPKKPQKPITSEEPKREKRKYVRKSTPKGNATTLSDGGIPSELSGNNEGVKVSCRRALNFNLESYPGEGSTGGAESCMLSFDSHSETQQKNTCESTNYNRDTSLQQGLQFNPILYVEQSDTGIGVDLNFSLTPNSLPATARKEPSKENMKFLARRKGIKQMPQCASNKIIGDTTRSVPENAFQHVLGIQTNSDVLSTVLSHSEKGLKRGFCETSITAEVDRTNLLDVHATGIKKSKTGVLQKDMDTNITSSLTEAGQNNCSSYPLCNNSEEINKANDQSCDFSYNGHSHSSGSGDKHKTTQSLNCHKGEASPDKVYNHQGMLTTTSEKVTMARPNASVEVWRLPLLTALTKDRQLPVWHGHEVDLDRTEGHYPKARKTKKHSTSLIESASSSIIYQAKSLESKPSSSDQYQQLVEGKESKSFVSDISLVEFSQSKMFNMNPVHSVHHSEAANKVLSYRNLVDEIVHRLKFLNINGQTSLSDENQNAHALVLYGGDGQMVTYDGPFDPIRRKQRPRAKVDLDSETLRVWDMLMWKDGSKANEAADPDKEKWWEEERRVFKGRADSFIARMHLVQGDRRFSRWKGSVVDSVIGVFLTQNVSDVLSSSAFMALAARFPLQSRSSNNDLPRGEGISRSDSPKWQESSLTQGMSNENSVILHEDHVNKEKEMINSIDCFGRCSADNSEDHPAAMGEDDQHNSSDENASNVVDEVILSQNSVISIRSCTESFKQIISHVSSSLEFDEVENLVPRSKCKGMLDAVDTPFTELSQMQGDGMREFHDEKACNRYEEWHKNEWCKNELYQEVHAEFSTALNQAQPITSIGENKNQISQIVPECTTDTSPVEDVISSQISVVSSMSSPESCIQTENSTSLVAKLNETGNVVTGFRCSSVFDRDKTSFTKLLQMQGDKMLQGLCRNNGYITEPSNKLTERTTLDSKYLSSVEQGTRPLWGPSETGWENSSIDESRSCLPSSASRIADTKDNCVRNRCQYADPRSHFTTLPISLSPFLSVDDSCAQLDRHAIQLSLGSEPKSLSDLEQRQESRTEEVQPGLIRSHLEKAVEIEENFSYVNNKNSVERNVAESEHRILLQGSSERHDSRRQKPQSGLVTQDIGEICDFVECSSSVNTANAADTKIVISKSELQSSEKSSNENITIKAKSRIKKIRDDRKKDIDWDSLRKGVCCQDQEKPRSCETMDSLDYEALRCADVKEIADAIRERGMNNMLAQRIKDFLNRMVHDHGSIDLEWLRDVPPDKAKEYLLSIRGLGLKSVECVRLLTLHHLAFPVDTNVGRIAVRLGWVPIQPLPESLQLHLLEMYPILESVQKYLWPRLCKLDQKTLYELHYQLITFGKVFCTKSKPNCNACPMRGECKHFASAFASARLALPGPEDKSLVSASVPVTTSGQNDVMRKLMPLPSLEGPQFTAESRINASEPIIEVSASVPLTTLGQNDAMKSLMSLPSLEGPHSAPESRINTSQPIIEEPTSPEPEKLDISESAMEEAFWQDDIEEIPTIKLNLEELSQNVQIYMQENNMELQNVDMSRALVALTAEAASIPMPKLKNVSRLRTEHQVYELPDGHTLLEELAPREPDDPSPYLLAIWSPGETANSIQPPEMSCESQELGSLCDKETCFACNSIKEANTQTVRGTLLIPCRTAMRGSFPLNGTYFQVNEVFADHDSSLEPINVPRGLIWNLRRRTVYFGTSVPTIFRGLTTEGIQHCFWRGFVCVRGFERKTRAPRPLMARLHLAASKLAKRNQDMKKSSESRPR